MPDPLTIDATDARNAFGQLIDRVMRGETVTILRFGRPVAIMAPAPLPPLPTSAEPEPDQAEGA